VSSKAEPLADEKALVARLRTGDDAAFNQVYARYHRELYAYLRRATGRTSTAEDLLQETWVKFAKATPRLLDDTRLAPYLFTIALNVYRSYRRWAAFDLSRVFALDLFGDDEPRTDGAALADARLEALELETALGELRESDRELVLLTSVHGFEPHEVAEMMNIAPDALRARLSRAREALRTVLQKAGRAARPMSQSKGEP
jgi:RNA polymerase sigma factor (sigma-70 family)